ncbi:putative nadph-cytochrome p450 reductase protein [Lasiodiplodia theobromae]|uniref:NADPH--cytochrome P450 reductase n=2 Tax=Lasiodiplodia TaxID=66739 RepID=A0A5N5DP20_9PEZI|nr:NADPh-cytochrome p450 reductase [Lasiodiplodia theobromae]KAB2579553.1 NADPH--cytochrome P450 reductase [Lasiodiplodia theobromae]KAF4542263.1 NADPh-cytochrome p450 reductase [Lasiodiplodia theobromae]KAF9635307.1 putative nadph-cytochrome p450 reductase protein [Lasiodiplodia theobromae]KAK0664897.1 NADPH--cytochrome P450 reductase [Lasiodiplodia hormozganensis]
MAQLDTLDIVVLAIILVGTVAYFTKGTYWAKPNDPYANSLANANGAKAGKSRNVLEKMDETGKNCVVFYGSQTGTAEDYASRLAKEGASRFGLKTMVADLEDYDYENLDVFPEDKVAIFVLATYGEGEPTDNAVEFYEFITSEDSAFSEGGSPDDQPLKNLKYVAFGLGNNTYEHYNSMVRNVDKALQKLGASRIGAAGEGDDGAGTMEEDFLAWKEPMWAALTEAMQLEEREAVYEPVFDVEEKLEMNAQDDTVYLGEPNKNHLEGQSKGPYNAHNPYIAPIAESRELFTSGERNCLHLEVDVSGSNLSYTTGDHIAVWPTNAGKEVDRFLRILGLAEKRDTVISVKGTDPTAKVPFPSPTTYDAVVRYHMEICAPVSRQFVSSLAPFAPNDTIKAEMAKMGGDKDYFQEKVSSLNLNIAQLLELQSNGEQWSKVPFSIMIEGLHKIQPRYYSISSSSLVQKDKISITAVVESIEKAGAPHIVKGVTTNYLLALKQKQHGVADPDPHGLNYALTGPRNKYDGIHVPVHVRHSNFKLPSDPSKPIIMVGPGTGAAPFRGFVQERAAQARAGENVGKTVLFFGCRRRDEDFLYKEEWEQYQKDLGDKFEMHTAFSREGPNKVYVQHKIQENAEMVDQLLQQKAYFYVCGDAANMARAVNELLGQIISKQRGLPESKGEEIVKSMRASNQYQEDVWS